MTNIYITSFVILSSFVTPVQHELIKPPSTTITCRVFELAVNDIKVGEKQSIIFSLNIHGEWSEDNPKFMKRLADPKQPIFDAISFCVANVMTVRPQDIKWNTTDRYDCPKNKTTYHLTGVDILSGAALAPCLSDL